MKKPIRCYIYHYSGKSGNDIVDGVARVEHEIQCMEDYNYFRGQVSRNLDVPLEGLIIHSLSLLGTDEAPPLSHYALQHKGTKRFVADLGKGEHHQDINFVESASDALRYTSRRECLVELKVPGFKEFLECVPLGVPY